ncbi:glycosyltransferase [Patescibacteria group bacterium]
MKIILTGGGTAGSVTPLLAVVEEINKISQGHSYTFIVTCNGQPEKELIRPYNIPFKRIISGKLRRYWSVLNILAPIFVIVGFIQSFIIFIQIRPQIVFNAGSYIGVPCVWAAWVLGIKVVILQPDIKPGLANVMTQMFASKIIVGFKETEKFFPKNKVIWLGNPVRPSLLDSVKEEAKKIFNLSKNIPVVLVLGGGTGSNNINELMISATREIQKSAYVIMVSGKGKSIESPKNDRIRMYDFLKNSEVGHALQVADVVVSRAGIGAISEFSLMKKACILIPLPHSPQERNAEMLSEKNAAISYQEKTLNAQKLAHVVIGLINNEHRRIELGNNIRSLCRADAAQRIAQLIISIGNS